ncbi:MAG: sigma-70 family RNA polymerase sigma factor [Anaerolineaceae bacterium]|nr:sigma-70 family RNA polymerase sigma factor [Anaerolineaceae bacterium]
MCKKICLVKKDPSLPDAPGNWIVMNGYEFCTFLKTPDGAQRKRNFVSMPPFDYDDPNDIWYIIEYSRRKRRKKAKSQENRAHYVKKNEFEYPLEIVSYSHMLDDGQEDDYEGLMIDPDCFVEDDAVDKLQWYEVLTAIDQLSEFDREVISSFYLCKIPETESEYAKRHRITQGSAHERKDRAIRNLRLIVCDQNMYCDEVPLGADQQKTINNTNKN